jgi:hypothetical protein
MHPFQRILVLFIIQRKVLEYFIIMNGLLHFMVSYCIHDKVIVSWADGTNAG